MYSIHYCLYSNLITTLENKHDPLLVDCNKELHYKLKEIYERDYVYVKFLANRGYNIVVLNNLIKGKNELNKLVKKCKKFERELIIIGESEKHLDFFKCSIIKN